MARSISPSDMLLLWLIVLNVVVVKWNTKLLWINHGLKKSKNGEKFYLIDCNSLGKDRSFTYLLAPSWRIGPQKDRKGKDRSIRSKIGCSPFINRTFQAEYKCTYETKQLLVLNGTLITNVSFPQVLKPHVRVADLFVRSTHTGGHAHHLFFCCSCFSFVPPPLNARV